MIKNDGYVVGIDPGKTGGLGILQAGAAPPGLKVGGLVAAVRWSEKLPVTIYNRLLLLKDKVSMAYIEEVGLFRQVGTGQMMQSQPLLINFGIWLGWLLVLGIPYRQVKPTAWQARFGLRHWAKEKKPGPLPLARSYWPTAPLDYSADSGPAVGLLLAEMARRDLMASLVPFAPGPPAGRPKKKRQRRQAQAQGAGPDRNGPGSLPGSRQQPSILYPGENDAHVQEKGLSAARCALRSR